MKKPCHVHNIRFYEPKPETICCMSLNRKKQKLALARLDGTIEIWNVKDSPYIEKTITSNVENYSIEGLEWFGDRLFSVGLHGFIIEYDLFKCTVLRKSIVTGEAAYCLNIHETRKQLAVGTEQGYLNIFDIKEDSLMYNKFFDKQEGRILCLKFHSSGSYIASGGLDAIRIWDVETGHAIHRMTTGRSEAEKYTIVWSLEFLDNLTVISGDSRGKLTFWDGKVGAQLESYQSHRADILSLCVSQDQMNLYYSGIDPNIHNFVKIENKGGQEKWVLSMQRKFEDHDVRSLVLNGDKLISGGSSAYLTISSQNPRKSAQYPPIMQNPVITLCKKARLIMLRHPKHMEIWTLSKSANLSKFKPKKIMTLQRLVKNHEKMEMKEGMTFATMSNDSMWIAYGTRLGLRIFQFINDEDDEPKLLRVENIDDTNKIHLNGIFTPDNTQLITVCPGDDIVVYEISNDSISVFQRLEAKELTDTISILKVSDNGKYLVAADTSSNIVLWNQESKGSWNYCCKLPKYNCAPVCLDIHPTKHNIIISYSNNRIIEYSISKREFTKLSKNLPHCLPADWTSRLYSVRNIFYNVAADKIILHDDNTMMVIEEKQVTEHKEGKKKKLDKKVEPAYNFKVVKKYKHLVYMGMLSDNEMVAVELDPLKLQEQLPPVLVMNKFGRK